MKIKINGEEETLESGAVSVTGLLKIKDVKMPDMVSVELNGDILDRNDFETTQINDGDEVEFLYFMGGGHSA
jgi:sulfur carrier protein